MKRNHHVKKQHLHRQSLYLFVVSFFLFSPCLLHGLQWTYPENLEMSGGLDLCGGGGTALGNIDGDLHRPDLVVMKYSREGASHYRFQYRVGWDVDGQARAARWSEDIYVDGVGDHSKGAGVAIADINNNGRADLLLMSFQEGSPDSSYTYNIAWDLDSHGRASSVSGIFRLSGGPGAHIRGAGVSIGELPGVEGRVAVFMVYQADGDRQSFMYKFKRLDEHGVCSTCVRDFVHSTGGVELQYNGRYFAATGVVGAGISFGYLDANSQPDIILMAKGCPTTRYRYRIIYNLGADGVGSHATAGYCEAGAMGFRSSGAGVAVGFLDTAGGGMDAFADGYADIVMMEVLPGTGVSDIKGYSYRLAHDFDYERGDNENARTQFGTYYINSDDEWEFRNEARTFRNEFNDKWPQAHAETLRNELFTGQALDYVDGVDLAYVACHGEQAGIGDNGPTYVNLDTCAYGSFSDSSRRGDADYIVFSSCSVLSMTGIWRPLWRAYRQSDYPKPFSGLHAALGFRTVKTATRFHYEVLAEEFAENLDDGMSVVDAWINATMTFRDHDWYSDDGPENLGAAFYIRPHRNEIIHHHDSPDYELIHSAYLLDALYVTTPFSRIDDIEP